MPPAPTLASRSESAPATAPRATLEARVWGARGSMPASGTRFSRYGGETSSVEVRAGERTVVIDAGSGAVAMGEALLAEGRRDIDLVLGHLHYDHVVGLPFFAPLHDAGSRVRIHHAGTSDRAGVEALVGDYFRQPFFPATLDCFAADVTFHALPPEGALEWDAGEEALRIETRPLNHPGGATGLRLAHGDRSLAYLTDFEHDGGAGDEALVALARDADIALLDATFTPEEYDARCGWGHAHWRAAAELATRAGVRRFGLFHHRHDRDDAGMAAIEAELTTDFPNGFVARTGQRL